MPVSNSPALPSPPTEDGTVFSPQRRRMIVPDVARGLALLGIAMANAPTGWFLDHDMERADFFGGATTRADDLIVLFTALTTHNRGLPMFATLLGFGVGLIAVSLWRKGRPLSQARRVLARRYMWLFLFGAVHAIFVFFGDIMTLYGLCGLVLTMLLTVKDSLLRKIAYGLLVLAILFGVASAVGAYYMPELFAQQMAEYTPQPVTYPDLLQEYAVFFLSTLAGTPMYMFYYLPVMIIGFTWARQGTLSDVPAHRKELITWAVLGAMAAVGVGLPWGLAEIEVLDPKWAMPLLMLNMTTGLLCGPGILAILALALDKVQQRLWQGTKTPLYLAVPAALGKRSMSGYLAQSLLFFCLAHPFTADLNLDAADMALVALGIWLVTLAAAWALEKAGKPGPFEWAHRRLSYGASLKY